MLATSLDHIRTFLVVARELHFTRAAAALHRSQPAVTQHVQRLESDLGVPLLTRHSRRVELTPAGARFAARMTDLVAAFDATIADLTGVDHHHTALRIGCTPSAASLIAPLRDATRAAQALPAISTAWEADLVADLRTGRQALIAGHALPTGPDIIARYLIDDPLRVLLPEQHDIAGGPALRLADLATTRDLVTGPPDLAPRWHGRITDLIRAASGHEPTVHVAPTTTTSWLADLRTALDATTKAYALVPASALPSGTPSRGLAPQLTVPLILAWLSTTVRADALAVGRGVSP